MMKATDEACTSLSENQPDGFPRDYYDAQYYERMGCGYYRHFIQHEGHSLPEWRMRDLDFLNLRPEFKLLDVGCGRGELVMYCGSKGIDSYGVDYSEAALAIGRSHLNFYDEDELKRIHLICCDVPILPFPDAYFDRIMSWAVVEHIFQPLLEQCLAELYRVLKPEGILVIGTQPNEWYEKYGYRIIRPIKQLFVGRTLESYSEMRALEPEHVNVKNPLSLSKDLRKQGFFCHVELLPRRKYEASSTFASRLGWALERLPLAQMLFRDSILAIAAKSPRTLTEFRREKGKGIR